MIVICKDEANPTTVSSTGKFFVLPPRLGNLPNFGVGVPNFGRDLQFD